MKHLTIFLILVTGTWAAKPVISLQPEKPRAGERCWLTIRYKERCRLQEQGNLPHFSWLGKRPYFKPVDGGFESSYPIIFNQAGSLELPALKIISKSGHFELPGRNVNVQQALLTKDELAKIVQLDLQLDRTQKIYKGQALPLTISLAVAADWDLRPAFDDQPFPTVSYHNLSFKKQKHSRSRIFQLSSKTEMRQGENWKVFTYQATCYPEKTGTLQGTFSLMLPLEKEKAKGMGTFLPEEKKQVNHHLHVNLPEVTVLPLPPMSRTGYQDIGLIGDFDFRFTLTEFEQAMRLSLHVDGPGNSERLAFPDIQVDGARSYEPQLALTNQGALIQWDLQQLAGGLQVNPLRLAYFSPEKGWQFRHLSPKGLGMGGDAGLKAFDAIAVHSFPIPLWQHHLWLNLLLLLAGPALLLYRRWARGWQAGAARRRALEKLRNILRGLDQAAANERALIINDQLLPCLRQLHELPSGSSLDELQEEIKDPEIVALLQQARATVYSGSKTELESYAVLKKLCPMLLLGLSLLPFVLHAATPVMTLFEKGQYEDCLAQLLHPEKQLRADIAYQRGSTYYRMGDFARAYGAFAQAERLLPNNAAIQHNLSLTQQRLDISVNKPLILWRLRPDQYWTMAGIALFLCFFLKRTWLRKIAGLMALAALAGGSYNCMNHYHPDNALIIRASSLHRLPAVSTVQSGTQAAGQTVRLLDQADDPQGNAWYYVRLQDQVGWLPATDLQPLFKQTEPQKVSPEAEGVEIEL